MCAHVRWIEYNTVHASAELNLDVFENKYSKDHNFKTNKDFSFKFGLNVIYILQNVIITLTLAIKHSGACSFIFNIWNFRDFWKKWLAF